MGLNIQTSNEHDNTTCFDDFFWKIIHDFCWSYKDRLLWEDFYDHINAKIASFPYSQNVMTMLYEFITKKTDLLHSRLFLGFIKNKTSNIDDILIRSILEEIVSRGKDCYETATVDLIDYIHLHGEYTIPGGLCSLFTTFDNTKIMKYEHIPSVADFSYVSSEEENENI